VLLPEKYSTARSVKSKTSRVYIDEGTLLKMRFAEYDDLEPSETVWKYKTINAPRNNKHTERVEEPLEFGGKGWPFAHADAVPETKVLTRSKIIETPSSPMCIIYLISTINVEPLVGSYRLRCTYDYNTEKYGLTE